jgi:hypothetical protein
MTRSTVRAAAIASGILLLTGLSAGTAQAFSPNSANNSGVYDSTFPAGPSLNGNNVGAAVGRPEAGAVGNADFKNPKGQLADATSDGNAGYECDTNNGIANGNPAHTGCEPTYPS